MDERLKRLIDDFRQRVAGVVALLEAQGVERPQSDSEWMIRRDLGRMRLPQGVEFIPHGRGFSARTRKWSINVDFGVHGEVDGFDPWRLWSFGGSRQGRYFTSEAELLQAFQQAIQAREFVQVNEIYYLRSGRAN
jgi:hypothetical protein